MTSSSSLHVHVRVYRDVRVHPAKVFPCPAGERAGKGPPAWQRGLDRLNVDLSQSANSQSPAMPNLSGIDLVRALTTSMLRSTRRWVSAHSIRARRPRAPGPPFLPFFGGVVPRGGLRFRALIVTPPPLPPLSIPLCTELSAELSRQFPKQVSLERGSFKRMEEDLYYLYVTMSPQGNKITRDTCVCVCVCLVCNYFYDRAGAQSAEYARKSAPADPTAHSSGQVHSLYKVVHIARG